MATGVLPETSSSLDIGYIRQKASVVSGCLCSMMFGFWLNVVLFYVPSCGVLYYVWFDGHILSQDSTAVESAYFHGSGQGTV